jgi:hypothetical protein
MARVRNHTVDDAPEASKDLLAEVARVSPTGRPLNLHAQMAAAPGVLQAYVALRRSPEEHSSLDGRVRIALMVAAANELGNDYTTRIVSMLAARAGWSPASVASLRAGRDTGDEKLDALAQVVREAARSTGRVSDGAWDRALRAGWGPAELVDAFSPLGLTLFTACFLNYAATDIDAELVVGPAA